MKKWRYIVLIILTMILSLAIASCGKKEQKTVLEQPTNLEIKYAVLSWEGVENADGYRITVNGEAFDEKKGRSCDLSSLTEVGVYELGVQAFDENKTYEDSPVATIEYTVGAEILNAALEYKLIEYNGEEGYEVKGSMYMRGEVEIPDYYNSKPVIAIAEGAFSSAALTIEDIGSNSNCNTLTTGVKLPAHLKIIGQFAFANCVSIEKMVIPDGVEKIEGCAFGGMLSLKEIEIPTSLKEIPGKFCSMCTSLKKIDIPNGVETIRIQAFQGAESLEQIVIPESVVRIDMEAFKNCSNLSEVQINGRPKEFSRTVFDGTAWLENYPSSFVTICGDILYRYKSEKIGEVVKEKDFPEHIRYIWSEAFQECKCLKSLSIPDNITLNRMVYMFKNCTRLQYIKLPSSITELGTRMFFGCDQLKTLVLPDSLQPEQMVSGWLLYETFKNGEVGVTSIENVYFGGTYDEWMKLMVKCPMDYGRLLEICKATIHFYGEEADETLAAGEYWCFDENGEIKVWKKEEDNPEAAIA